MQTGEVAMRKSIPALRQDVYESISDFPRVQKSCREKALVVIQYFELVDSQGFKLPSAERRQ